MNAFLKYVLFLLAFLSLFGCRARKIVTKEKYTVEEQAHKYERDTAAKVELRLTDIINNTQEYFSDSTSLSWQATIYTPPDTAGVQYIDRIIKGQFYKKSGAVARRLSNVRDTISVKMNSISEKKSDTTKLIQSNKKIVEKRHFKLSWWQALLLCLGGLFFLRKIYRYYKLKKP